MCNVSNSFLVTISYFSNGKEPLVLHFFLLSYWRNVTLLRRGSIKCILVFLLVNDLYIAFISSSSRLKISRIVSIWLRRSMLNISHVPSLHSVFSMRLMQWKNNFSCCFLVVGSMILDGVDIKDVSNCWISIVHTKHYNFLVFILRMEYVFLILYRIKCCYLWLWWLI